MVSVRLTESRLIALPKDRWTNRRSTRLLKVKRCRNQFSGTRFFRNRLRLFRILGLELGVCILNYGNTHRISVSRSLTKIPSDLSTGGAQVGA